MAVLVVVACQPSASSAAEPSFTDVPLAGRLGEPGHLDGQGGEARIRRTQFGCLDAAGNLYIAESGTVRRISPSGEVRTLAGVARTLDVVDGVGAEARFSNYEFPLAADAADNVYTVDSRSHVVRKITPRGEVTTVAGRRNFAGFEDGPASVARFSRPSGIVVDSAGFLYVSDTDNRAIRRISPAGEVTTVTRSTTFAYPTGLAIDGRDKVYVAEGDGQFVQTIHILMPDGTATRTRWGELGIRPSYLYNESEGINFRIDASGNLLVHQHDDGWLRRLTPESVETDRFRSDGLNGFADLGLGLLAVDRDGVIFLVDQGVIKRRILSAPAKSIPAWSPAPPAAGHTVSGVAYGNGTFVLSGNREPGAEPQSPLISTSPDGVTWSHRAAPATGTAATVQHVHDRFFLGLRLGAPAATGVGSVAAGSSILTSTDGLGWFSSDRLEFQGQPVNAPEDFAYGNGLYVAAVPPTAHSQAIALSSADGRQWTARAIDDSPGVGPARVVHFRDRFFALAPRRDRAGSGLHSSTDAVTWAPVPTAPAPLHGLAASDDALIVTRVHPDESDATGAVTTDGISFQPLPAAAAGYLGAGIRFVHHAFMIVSGEAPQPDRAPDGVALHASHDGHTWTTVGSLGPPDAAVVGFAAVAGRHVVATARGVYTGLTDVAPGGQPGTRATGSRFNHLSVRARIGGEGGLLTVGVAVADTATGPAGGLLLRALGPALGPFGLAAVGDPRLAWLSGESIVATNDDWSGAPDLLRATAAAGAFPLPAGSRDAALLLSSVRPGLYTLQATAADRSPGLALVEVHDLTPSSPPTATAGRLVNLSARALVAPDGDRLIAGFEVAGGPARVLLRAVGPTLGHFAVRNHLSDPWLELYRGPVLVAANDDWHPATAPEPLQRRVGAFGLPARSRDAALTTTLPPGTYTVHVAHAGPETGVALIEVFEIP
jgi:hypothetical protein